MRLHQREISNSSLALVSFCRYWENALRDLRIAKDSEVPEVRFTFSYQAMIKAGDMEATTTLERAA